MSAERRVYVGGSLFRAGLGSVPGWGVITCGERIEAVLPDEALRREARASAAGGTAVEVIELEGRFISPGFIDAHLHPVLAGTEAGLCDLSEAASVDEAFRLIADYAAAHPELEWIEGGGWSMDWFEGGNPRAEQLDALVGSRPAFLSNRDHHGHWASSEALRRAGITSASPDPEGGRIERGADGSPTGTLHEAAGGLVSRLLPERSDVQRLEGLLRAQQIAFSLGVVGWQDAAVGPNAVNGDSFEVYLGAVERGQLRARVDLAHWWDRDLGLEQIEEMLERRSIARERTPQLGASSVKLMVDGVAENFTAAVSAPYLDAHGQSGCNHGHSFIEAGRLGEIVELLDANGFQAHFHALGDRAVTEALDAVERALAANGRRDNRHHLAHLQMIRLSDVPRFAELGAAANLQALWAQAEPQMLELTLPFLDASLRDRQYPFGDLLRAGTRLVAGSDWPVSSAYPLDAMQVAVTRRLMGGEGPALLPEQSLPLEAIWAAYTAGSAWVTRREHEAGALDAGKLADLVLLDRDPFVGDPELIAETRVTATVLGGETVYEA